MSGVMAIPDELLRVEFGREMFMRMPDPLDFVLREVQAIVERGIPPEVAVQIPAAAKLVVTITAE